MFVLSSILIKRELVRKVVRWLCEGTAKHAGLDSVKGKIQVGFDADFVVWDPEREFTVCFHLIIPLSLSTHLLPIFS